MAALLRGACRAASARARLRGFPLGRRRPARLHRAPRRLGADVPMLILCTARLELLERRPAGAEGRQRRDRRAGAAVGRRDGAADRGLSDRPLLEAGRRPRRSRAPAVTRCTPSSTCACSPSAERRRAAATESVQGIIAARLDSLPPEEKRCCRTPPSSGRSSGSARSAATEETSVCTRWSGRSSCSARDAARSPARRSSRSSTCWSAMSPMDRSRVRSARESTSSRRVDRVARPARDHAEMVAHHYADALELHARRVRTSATSLSAHGERCAMPGTGRDTQRAGAGGGLPPVRP